MRSREKVNILLSASNKNKRLIVFSRTAQSILKVKSYVKSILKLITFMSKQINVLGEKNQLV